MIIVPGGLKEIAKEEHMETLELQPSATGSRTGLLIPGRRGALRAAAILAVLFTHGCEISTSISVEGKAPPVFRLSGTGSIHEFGVARTDTQDPSRILWSIEAERGGVVEIRRLGPITYGIVPAGFVQKVPAGGARPSPLQDGVRYGAGASTINAWGGDGCYFVMKDGHAIQE